MGKTSAHCPPRALLCMGTAKHPCGQKDCGLTLWFCLLSCTTILGSALIPWSRQHQYCKPICIIPTAPSASFLQICLPPPAGLLPVGCGGHWAPPAHPCPAPCRGAQCGLGSGWREAAAADGRQGRITAMRATRDVCVPRRGPFARAGCELVPAGPQPAPARPRHSSQQASWGGCS